MNRISMALLGVLTLSAVAAAAPSGRSGATDLIVLNNGWRLRGIILTETPDPETTSLLVRTEWITASVPELPSAVRPEEHPAADAAGRIRFEIDRLKTAGSPDNARIGFLETRVAELDFFASNPTDDPLIAIVRIPNRLIRLQWKPSQPAREVGFYGILNNVDRTEELSLKRLRKKLEALPPESVVRHLPNADSISEDSLIRNVFLNADSQLAPSCQLIRIGDTVFDAGDDHNAAEIAMHVLTEQLKRDLLAIDSNGFGSGATDKPLTTLPESAIDIAQNKSAAVVDVAEVRLNIASGTATVRLTLFHRDSTLSQPHSFELVGSVTATATAADVPPDRAKAIAADPRIKQALQIFGALGTGQQDITKAMNMGAVVEAAQQDAQRQLQDLIPALLELLNQPQVKEIIVVLH